jgi:hypothetical protein
VRFLDTKQKGNRPSFKPTASDRQSVRIGTAAGLTASEMAALLGISRGTLRTHLADELREARARALVENLKRLDRAAQRGSVSAAKFLVTCFANGAPAIGGKKAAAERRAKQLVSGDSVWADLLNPREAYQR